MKISYDYNWAMLIIRENEFNEKLKTMKRLLSREFPIHIAETTFDFMYDLQSIWRSFDTIIPTNHKITP